MNSGKLITGVLIGAAAGAILGILFAPDKGSETRKKVSEEGKKLAHSLKDKFSRVREKADEVASNIQESIDELESKAEMMREKMNQYSNT